MITVHFTEGEASKVEEALQDLERQKVNEGDPMMATIEVIREAMVAVRRASRGQQAPASIGDKSGMGAVGLALEMWSLGHHTEAHARLCEAARLVIEYADKPERDFIAEQLEALARKFRD